jgi:hypothetical protein
LFALDTPTAQPRRFLPNSGGVEWLLAEGDALFVGTRDAGTLRIKPGTDRPEPIGPSFGSFRSHTRWGNRTLIATDAGVWHPNGTPPAVLRVENVAGFQSWGDDLLIGSNSGLFLWRRGEVGPKLVLPEQISSLFDWNGTAVISADSGLWLWPKESAEPRRFPIEFGPVDSFALWRGGLVMGLANGGSLKFLDEHELSTGRIELSPVAHYEVGQTVYISWRIVESRQAGTPNFFEQKIKVLDDTGNVIRLMDITERNRKAPTEFEANVTPLPANENYHVTIEATPPVGSAFASSAQLKVGGSTPFSFWHFIGWHRPADLSELLGMIGGNAAALSGSYLTLVLLLFILRPALLVSLHEALSAGKIPGGDFVAKFAPFLVSSGRCLDAFVEREITRTNRRFNEEPDVRIRPTWVPAPVKVNGELIAALLILVLPMRIYLVCSKSGGRSHADHVPSSPLKDRAASENRPWLFKSRDGRRVNARRRAFYRTECCLS